MMDQWTVSQRVYGCDDADFDPRQVIEDVMQENADWAEKFYFAVDVFVHTRNEGYLCHKRHFTVIVHLGPERPQLSHSPAV